VDHPQADAGGRGHDIEDRAFVVAVAGDG
jgi:hypothetical protein